MSVVRNLIRQRVRTDDFQQQLGDGLLDLRALDLENGRGGVGLVFAVAPPLGGDDAQLRHLQRLEFDLDGGDLGAEALVGEKRLAVGLLDRGELLQAADARFGNADAGDAAAFVAEQELGVVPALVLLADQILRPAP